MIDVKTELMLEDIAKEISFVDDQTEASAAGAVARFNILNKTFDEMKRQINDTDRANMPEPLKLAYVQLTVAMKRAIKEECEIIRQSIRG